LFSRPSLTLTLPNCLYCLKTIFTSCEKLVEEFGYFILTDNMVGVTHEKQCKIWINENLEKNCVMLPTDSEQEMIDSIICIIEPLLSEG
jgi:hypothetical protein